MTKHLLQDIVKTKHASHETRAENTYREAAFRRENDFQINGKVGKTRNVLWLVAVISIIFLLFAISYLFLSASIVINPKTQELSLNENLSALKDANNNGLFFNLLVDNISGEESKNIQATLEKDISKKATGTVVIFNTFSSSSQRLTIDTRLEGSNGKMYKTEKAIVIPGMKGSIPGSIEVGIYAAEAGEAYNSGPLDFSIFGFKGSPKYSKFKVRTKTGTNITGGFIGKANTISDTEKEAILAELKSSLKTQLLTKAISQIPPGFVLFKDAVFINTEEPVISSAPDQNNNFLVTVKGTLFGFIFNEKRLTQKIAQDNIDKYDGSDVYISNMKDLTFSMLTSVQDTSSLYARNLQNINFNLSGVAKVVWKVNENQLIGDLLGKSKKDFNQILSQYPNIDSAELKVRPFWKTYLPDKSKNIEVIVNYPK